MQEPFGLCLRDPVLAVSAEGFGNSLVIVCSSNTNGIMVGAWMLWPSHSSQDERKYGLGMDALVIALMNGSTVWAWMLW